MLRFRIGVVAAVTLCLGVAQTEISGHGGLRRSDPAVGVALGASPKAVRLFFSEQPEPSLSEIRVLDASGQAYQTGRPEPVAGDPLSLIVPVRTMDRGIYFVNWRIVSAVDGHATAGTFAFGVRMVPTNAAVGGLTINRPPSRFEMLARWLFIAGLVLLLGAAAATSARFGGPSDVGLAASGVILSVIGLALLAIAQTRAADASFAGLLRTGVGRALLGRAAAIAIAGGALLIALIRPATRARALSAAGIAALAAVAVHVGSGHAAAGGKWHFAVGVAVQWTHFVATGVWLGGLAALLLAIHGAPSNSKTELVHRFSSLAPVALVLAAVTGSFRSYGELTRWSDLTSTDYGRTVSAKIALTGAIAAVAAVNRWRTVPRASLSLRPLRRVASGELLLMIMALGAAAVLGTLPPPISGFGAVRPLNASGSDFGTTVRVDLTTASDQPGPNDFSVRAVDYDSRQPVQAQRISLRFTPLDDPGIAPTSLSLERGRDNLFSGSGANLAFDGRWQVTVLVEGSTDSVAVPLNLDVRGPPLMVSAVRVPGRVPHYTVEVPRIGHVRIAPDHERAGPNKVYVTCFDVLFEPRPIEDLVVTAAADDGPVRQLSVHRLDRNRFVADVVFQPGRNTIATIARSADGARTRTTVDLDIPR